jgi:hypothetical protein
MNNVGVEPVDAWTVLYALRTIARSESGMSKELPIERILRVGDAATATRLAVAGEIPTVGRSCRVEGRRRSH